MNTSGGYDFEVVGTLVKEYECPICLLLLRDAVELPCTHALCGTCLHKWEIDPVDKDVGFLCPSCKVAYQRDKVRSMIFVDRIITTSLEIKCKENTQGCNWQGTISDYNDHEKKCAFKSVKCDFVGCDMKVQRTNLHQHKEQCVHRLIKCNYCCMQETYNNINVHYEVCTSYPVKCPNEGCDLSLVRKQVTGHMQHDCKSQVIDCEYKSVGCNAIVQRKHFQDHVDKSISQHMKMLLRHSDVTTADLKETKSKLITVEEKLACTADDLKETKGKLHVVEENLTQTQNTLKEFVEREKKSIETMLELQKDSIVKQHKIQEIEKDVKGIADSCLQSTKVLMLYIVKQTTIVIPIINELFESYINILPDEVCQKYKKHNQLLIQQQQPLEIYIDAATEETFGIKMNKDKTTLEQQVELLEHMKTTTTFQHNDIPELYTTRFQKLLNTMESCKFYFVGNNEIYIKINIKDYIAIGTILQMYIQPTSYRNNCKRYKAFTNDFALNGNYIYFFLDGWDVKTSKIMIVHPQREHL